MSIIVQFLVQTAAGIISALVVLVVQARWNRTPGKPGQEGELPPGTSGGQGNHATITGNGNTVQQQYHSTVTNTTVHAARQTDAGSGQTDDLLAILGGGLIGILAVAGLFMAGRPFIGPILFGMAAGLTIRSLLAAKAVRRSGLQFDGTSRSVVVGGPVSAALSSVSWILVNRTERGGISLDGIAAAIPPMTTAQGKAGLSGWVEHLFKGILPALYGTERLGFVLSLLIGTLFAVLLLLLSWRFLVDFESYLSIANGSSASARTLKRAERYQSLGLFQTTTILTITAVICLAASTGLLYDGMTYAQNLAQRPT